LKIETNGKNTKENREKEEKNNKRKNNLVAFSWQLLWLLFCQ